ncbi:MAG: hypothetical protein JRF02_00515 [Deltaproteobacteria bacterium]|jgi:hypothetical protein|nr:hypothetical protein [Deltaproteobacteria bacterium]
MKKTTMLLFSFLIFLCISPAAAQASGDDIAGSGFQFEQWAKNLAEFVRDVRFNEKDIQSFISLSHDFDQIGKNEDYGEGEYVDFSSILKDKSYLAWAQSKGINSEAWLKKTMRIVAVMLRNEMEANAPAMTFDMQAQLAELEKMKAQFGEETYQQMKQALTASGAAMAELDRSYKHLPMPTDAEKELLEKYKSQLMNLE